MQPVDDAEAVTTSIFKSIIDRPLRDVALADGLSFPSAHNDIGLQF